ncbi:unnamed protein product [Caenorhabditis brenneri]
MTMKLLLAIICVILCSATSNEIRAKRDLSPDVRNKLIEVLNKDSQEIGKKLNIKMETIIYDRYLERSIRLSEKDCIKSSSSSLGPTLDGDSLTRDLVYNKAVDFYIPSHKTIGCSKDFECSISYSRGDTFVEELIGKTAVLRGICIFGEPSNVSKEDLDKIRNADLPMPWKYGDLIGVNGSSEGESGSGKVIRFIICILLSVYI